MLPYNNEIGTVGKLSLKPTKVSMYFDVPANLKRNLLQANP